MTPRMMGDFYTPDIGDKCPFCGKKWTDSSACGDPEPGMRRGYFAKRTVALFEKQCENCERQFVTSRDTAKYCGQDCSTAAYRVRKQEARRTK